MALSIPNPFGGKTVSLPIVGAVSLTAVIGGGILLYLLLRKKRITSKTIITRFGK
jgi:NhaP-type Na+/H+ or K+/H+ antiporter